MKKVTFKNLVDYCFNELSTDQRIDVEIELIQNEAIFSTISGINFLKRKLGGNRAAVEQYLDHQSEQPVQQKRIPIKYL